MKGAIKMMKTTVEETAGILKRLTPQNQAYFMTLVRVAEIAENGVKNTVFEQPCPQMQTVQLMYSQKADGIQGNHIRKTAEIAK